MATTKFCLVSNVFLIVAIMIDTMAYNQAVNPLIGLREVDSKNDLLRYETRSANPQGLA